MPLKFIYNDNKSCKKLNIHSISIDIWSAGIKDVLQKYWLKNCVKRYVLSPFFQLANGSEFHSLGGHTEKVFSPWVFEVVLELLRCGPQVPERPSITVP